MKKILILMAFFALVTTSCSYKLNLSDSYSDSAASSNTTTRNEKLNSFNAIDACLPYEIKVMQGDESNILVKGPEKYVNDISINVNNNTLYLTQKDHSFGFFHLTPHITILITTPLLQSFELSGSANTVINFSKQPSMYLKVSGSGNIELSRFSCNNFDANVSGSGNLTCKEIKCQKVKANVSGSGSVLLTGQADTGVYYVSGSGNISSKDLVMNKLDTEVRGSGSISCNAMTLKKSVHGSGNCDNYFKE